MQQPFLHLNRVEGSSNLRTPQSILDTVTHELPIRQTWLGAPTKKTLASHCLACSHPAFQPHCTASHQSACRAQSRLGLGTCSSLCLHPSLPRQLGPSALCSSGAWYGLIIPLYCNCLLNCLLSPKTLWGQEPYLASLPLNPQSLVQFLAQSRKRKWTHQVRLCQSEWSVALKAWNTLRNEDRGLTGRECERAA